MLEADSGLSGTLRLEPEDAGMMSSGRIGVSYFLRVESGERATELPQALDPISRKPWKGRDIG